MCGSPFLHLFESNRHVERRCDRVEGAEAEAPKGASAVVYAAFDKGASDSESADVGRDVEMSDPAHIWPSDERVDVEAAHPGKRAICVGNKEGLALLLESVEPRQPFVVS